MYARQEILDAIEQLIDQSDLKQCLEDIVQICHAKAEHLRSNWQDEVGARSWERDAKKLDRLKVEN
jgi:hypothetical protein